MHGPLLRKINQLMPRVWKFQLQKADPDSMRQSLAQQRVRSMFNTMDKDYEDYLKMQALVTRDEAARLLELMDTEYHETDKVPKMKDLLEFKPEPSKHKQRILDRRLDELFAEGQGHVTEYEVKLAFIRAVTERQVKVNHSFDYEEYIKAKYKQGDAIHMSCRFPVHPRPDVTTHVPE